MPGEFEDDDTLLLTNVAQDGGDDGDDGNQEDTAPDILFADEIPAEGAAEDDASPDLPKRLRRELDTRGRDLAAAKREKADLERQIAELKAPKIEPVGKKPDLWEDCDGDVEKYDAELLAYEGRKRQVESAGDAKRKAEEAQAAKVTRMFETYNTQKAELGRADFADAESAVVSILSVEQQGLLVEAADNPAKLIYALGKSPAKLAMLAGMDSLAKFTATIGKLEGSITMGAQRKAPPPEKVTRGAGSVAAGGGDKRLADLEARAEKSGDYTDVIKYQMKKG